MTTLTTEERNDLVLAYMKLANKIAHNKHRKTPFVAYDELQSAAYFGLVDAAAKYDPSKNDCFGAYAALRIAGAICDYLRELSWGSRDNPVEMSDVYEEQILAKTEPQPEIEFFDKVTFHW